MYRKATIQNRQRTARKRAILGIAFAAIPFTLHAASGHSVWAQDADKQPEKVDQAQAHGHVQHDSAALGVMVASCPGRGVLVVDVIDGGPADKAGIQPGDFILAVNDQEFATPTGLQQAIQGLTPDDTPNITVWRQGRDVTKAIPLASESKQLHENHRAWLGVMLSRDENNDQSIVVQRVQDGSPAEEAGFQEGDQLLKLNGTPIQSSEKFIEDVRDLGPGSKLSLTVDRDGAQQDLDVVLGEVATAPVEWFHMIIEEPSMMARERMPMMPPHLRGGQAGFQNRSGNMMGEMIDQMRSELRELKNDMRQIKAGLQKSGEKPELSKPKPPVDNDLSFIDEVDGPMQYVLQVGGITRDFPPNISNDWSGSRYRNRGNSGYGYRNNYGNYGNYGRNNSYQSGYGRYPYNNSYSPYQYYNYGGRPYYYGGGYPFGYRGGIRLGSGLNIYW